jgi:hypothetical protein
MTSLKQNRIIVVQNRIIGAVALLLACLMSLWLLTRSGITVPATRAGLAAFLIAAALISVNTWKNGKAATATLLHVWLG